MVVSCFGGVGGGGGSLLGASSATGGGPLAKGGALAVGRIPSLIPPLLLDVSMAT